MLPVRTRKNANWPTCGSSTVLNTKAAAGPSAAGFTIVPSDATRVRSRGFWLMLMMPFITSDTPMSRATLPAKIGISVPAFSAS